MSDTLKLSLDSKKFEAALSKMAEDMQARIRTTAVTAALEVLNGFRIENIVSQDLVDTGTLMSNWQIVVDEQLANYTGGYVGTNLPYAAIHEYGGVIRPKKAKTLVWTDKDGVVHFSKLVTIPARPYLRPALYDHRNDLQRTFEVVLAAEIASSVKGG